VSAPSASENVLRAPALPSLGAFLGHHLWLAPLRANWAATLPIADLPSGVGMLPTSELSLVLAKEEGTRASLLRSLFTSALPRRRVTWVCASGKAPQGLTSEVHAAASRRQLLAFAWAHEAASHVRQLGATQLLRELALAGMRPHDLLVLDALDPWLAQLPGDSALEALVEEAVGNLQRLAKAHRGPVLAFAPTQIRGQSLLPLLAHTSLAHIAALDLTSIQPHLDFVRWRAAHSLRSSKEGAGFSLQLGADGAWHCRERRATDMQHLLTSNDAQMTHVQRGVLLDASATPANWRVHASLESLMEAARDAVAATVVLAHESPEDVVALADAVYRLRREHPRLLKILVRETGATLRKNGELALLRVGANAVVGREQGFGHLVQIIDEIREQPYGRSSEVQPAQALQALAPDPVQGYLPLAAFCSAVERMLERTAGTALEHSLVHIPLLAHVAHLDALLACHSRRDGDVVTADAQGLVLFLFGCAPENAMAALDAVFSIPCSELARMVQIEADATSQRQVLARLRRAADQAPLDFSTILRGISPVRRPTPVQAVVLPTRSAEAARSVHAHVLPLRAAAA